MPNENNGVGQSQPNSLIYVLNTVIPDDWALTPVNGQKHAYTKEWTKTPVSRDSIAIDVDRGKAKGFGLITGKLSVGIMAIDCDGHKPHDLFKDILGGDIPHTVTFTSGKDGRAQYLFQVPEEHWDIVKTKKFGDADDGGLLELRWDGCQSVLPPSVHPETGQYEWINSPEDTEIAPLPDKVLAYWKQLISKPPTSSSKTTPKKAGRPPSILPQVKEKINSYNGQIPANQTSDLERQISNVIKAPNGSRNDKLRDASLALGRMSQNGLDRETAFELLWWGAEVNGVGVDEPEQCERTINGGLDDGGRVEPWRVKNQSKSSGKLNVPEPLEMAEKLVCDVLNNTLYDALNGQWSIYENTGKWVTVSSETIFAKVQKFLKIEIETFKPAYIDNCLRFAKSDVLCEGWEEAPSSNYLPFENGVLDLKTKKLLSHSPDYRFTWQLPRQYLVDTSNSEWLAIDDFLNILTCGNKELRDLALAFCNAVLIGRYEVQKFLCLIGKGGKGKGTFLSVLRMLVGGINTHSTSMEELNNNRFETANLRSKKLLIMPDERGGDKKIDTLLKVTGNDPIRYERKGKDATNFIFQGVLIIAANKPIFTGNYDSAIKRRAVNFPCNAQIDNVRTDLLNEFKSDLPAFTHYLLSLSDEWVEQTIRKASSIEAIKELDKEVAIRQNSIASFCEEGIIRFGEYSLTSNDLYSRYKTYCSDSGLLPKNKNNFKAEFLEYLEDDSMGRKVTSKRTSTGVIFYGVGFRRI